MSKLIALDAGHFMGTPGRRVWKQFDANETREWWLNNRVAVYTAAELARYDCRVMRVDDTTGATDVPLNTRADRANAANADVFVAIHHNGGIHGGKGGGISIFVSPNASADSKRLQREVYDAAIRLTGLSGNRSSPLGTGNFTVVNRPKMPSTLIECGFMDSATDAPIIITDEFAQKCGKGIAEGIVKFAGLVLLHDSDIEDGEPIEPPDEAGHWAFPSMQYLTSIGITISEMRFDDPITRGEMFTLLAKYHKAIAAGGSPTPAE